MARLARHPATWIVAGIAVAFALRAAWLDAPLGRDEGGDAYVARAWDHSGPFAYGPYFLDRPPLLLALYRAAVLAHGALGIRVLGALAAAAAVALITLLANRLGGRRAAIGASLVGAVLVSSYAIASVDTPAELLAILPSTGSILCLVSGLEREGRRAHWLLAAAGLLAGLALMVKQSFGDALVAGVLALVAVAVLRQVRRRELALCAASYAAGLAAVVGALVVWEQLARTPDESVWYALVGFRLDAASALAGSDVSGHATRLVMPALGSGLALGVILAAAGLASLRARPVALVALAAWLLAGTAGIALGGSYWSHYLIQLVPVTAVGAGLALTQWRRAGTLAALAVALPAVAYTLLGVHRERPETEQTTAVAVGHYVRSRALPNQTLYVLYARANVLWYSGMRNPFPYDWSLMMEAVPGAEQRLRALLASPRRPTWVVAWQGTRAFRLDRSGATRRLLHVHYRLVARVCGRRVLLARGAPARAAPPLPPACVVRT